jgi:hypothetical protein
MIAGERELVAPGGHGGFGGEDEGLSAGGPMIAGL